MQDPTKNMKIFENGEKIERNQIAGMNGGWAHLDCSFGKLLRKMDI